MIHGSGRWRRERGGIEGVGILLGLYWVFPSVAWLYHII